jgi:Putative auto-transporter adhesin, head GIN domain
MTLSATIILMALTACVNGEMAISVTGNRNVVKKDREAGRFTGVKVSTGIDVFLTQGQGNSITVEVDENLHEYLMTENRDGVLHIWFKASVRSAESRKVYITMKDIDYLATSSAGDISGLTPVKSENLKLNASSAGDIKLCHKCRSRD